MIRRGLGGAAPARVVPALEGNGASTRSGEPHPLDASVAARPWPHARPPRCILAIRLHAMGDTVITLPYLRGVRALFPECRLDFVTLEENAPIPRSLVLFDRVYGLGGGRRYRRQLLAALLLIPRLVARRYEVVLDLQDGPISRLIRRAIRPAAWCEFDRVSARPAGERTARTIRGAGFAVEGVLGAPVLRDPDAGLRLLEASGWQPGTMLVVLNPAGLFPSRNWPLAHWCALAADLRERLRGRSGAGATARFLFLGLPSLAEKARALAAQLGPDAINLVGRTTAAEAFAILQRASLVVSEDSGLMHMAWTSGIPTMALLGSTRGDWARPLGEHSICLDSGDLPCGNCMEALCRFGDTRCLTRYSPAMVAELALGLLDRRDGGR